MGKRIVEELGLTDSCETLAKWMAHLVAERIREVESEEDVVRKRKLESECVELIKGLWERRACLPGGAAPLGTIQEAMAALKSIQDDIKGFYHVRRAAQEMGSPWLEFACNSHALDRNLSVIAYLTALLESDFETAKRWLAESGNMLSADERRLIESLDRWLDSESVFGIPSDSVSIRGLAPEDRKERVLRKLKELLADQTAALQRLRERLAGKSH